ncbi:hypothetical protein O181_076745 [Austropuccinia psidii MF-1]|uniref:Uncharacterized protein n=1 Tax=Austropuccinia psidii MF-1 TaxID=1389203 RepID=A0A9Q3F9C6_9BASI|nr:hypothetical protein [Austropuccinia psidii MF-1]
MNESKPLLPRNFRPEDYPISPTLGPRETSTPATEPRTQNIPRGAFVTTPNAPIPLQKQVLRQERPFFKIKEKDYNPNFDVEEVEKCFRKVEIIAKIKGETDEEQAMKMTFWTTEPRMSDAIGAMPVYEEGNWTQLKRDHITKWGRVEPERRYRKGSLIKLFKYTQEDGGIGNISKYKKFIGDYETIVTYLLRYRYILQDNMFHEGLFDCLSADFTGSISKEIIKDNVMVRAEDGG